MVSNQWRIHFQGSPNSFELYNEKGQYIFTKKEAIEYCKNNYPKDSWEVFNGKIGFLHKWKD